jgi:DNA-binding NtrC family response regulator
MQPPNRVLVVEDEDKLRRVLVRLLADEHYEVAEADTGEKALALVPGFGPDVVVMDQNLPGISGLEAAERIVEQVPGAKVIVVTAFGAIDRAVEAMRRGAHDYLTKPFDNAELLMRVQRAMELRRLACEVADLREALGERCSFERILGKSASLQAVLHLARRAAQSEVSVLVEGESGTGKELLVRAIHHAGSRANGPLVAVNCAAVPGELVESAFFGHAKGAFTGAGEPHTGWFEQAHRGTLFLDEISEMPVGLQAKLLRALEEREITPLGGDAPIQVDVRVIAATNHAAVEAVRSGVLREDLYHRLAVVSIRIPPLRERPDDIPLLARHFLALSGQEARISSRTFSGEALTCLEAYPWPGNVRELRNAVQSAVLMGEREVIRVCDLPSAVQAAWAGRGSGPEGVAAPHLPTLAEAVAAVEQRTIGQVLAEEKGNKTRAAERLGITRKTLLAKMVQYRLQPEVE